MKLAGGAHTLRYVAIVPAILIVFFSYLLKQRREPTAGRGEAIMVENSVYFKRKKV